MSLAPETSVALQDASFRFVSTILSQVAATTSPSKYKADEWKHQYSFRKSDVNLKLAKNRRRYRHDDVKVNAECAAVAYRGN